MHRQECFSLNLQHTFRELHYYFQSFTITIYRLISQDIYIYKTNLLADKYMLLKLALPDLSHVCNLPNKGKKKIYEWRFILLLHCYI